MTAADLRAWRTSKNLSQAALAALLNLPQQRISEWEREVHRVPRWMAFELERLEGKIKGGGMKTRTR